MPYNVIWPAVTPQQAAAQPPPQQRRVPLGRYQNGEPMPPLPRVAHPPAPTSPSRGNSAMHGRGGPPVRGSCAWRPTFVRGGRGGYNIRRGGGRANHSSGGGRGACNHNNTNSTVPVPAAATLGEAQANTAQHLHGGALTAAVVEGRAAAALRGASSSDRPRGGGCRPRRGCGSRPNISISASNVLLQQDTTLSPVGQAVNIAPAPPQTTEAAPAEKLATTAEGTSAGGSCT